MKTRYRCTHKSIKYMYKTSRIGMQQEIELEKVFAKKRTNGPRYVMIKIHGLVCYPPVKKFLKIEKQMFLKIP